VPQLGGTFRNVIKVAPPAISTQGGYSAQKGDTLMDVTRVPVTLATATCLVALYLVNLSPWIRNTNILTLVVTNTFMGYFFIW
jgi:hypothetical protein